ncbi:Methylosome subunit pICln [Clonorchis sinensis]|uniref:Chloride channel nucleotide-sensitive 1A n=2 Tax=Clonorchis sinensis TaxID=79923 RepID=H2KQR4_CLOSI|nr:Methylosome subunit pICln [Clonorchis sinensis]GAA37952.2 chloride channel nucleotide-sensitive 1A [Clonorchis sinensis]
MVAACGVPPSLVVRQPNVSLFEGFQNLDVGTVVIDERYFTWEGQSRQFSVPYQQITLHAISKDPVIAAGDQSAPENTFPHPHLLVMIDGDRPYSPPHPNGQSAGEPMAIDGAERPDTEDSDESQEDATSQSRASDCPGETTILRFVPQDPNALDTMYAALAECQALNPDSTDDLSASDVEDEEDDFRIPRDMDSLDSDQYADD